MTMMIPSTAVVLRRRFVLVGFDAVYGDNEETIVFSFLGNSSNDCSLYGFITNNSSRSLNIA